MLQMTLLFFGISSYGVYMFGTVMLGGIDLTPGFATLPDIVVTSKDATLWCEGVKFTL